MSHLNIQLLLSLVVVFYLLEEGTIVTPHHPSMPTHQTTKSWIHVGDLPTPLRKTCSIVTNGELMVIGGGKKLSSYSKQVFRAFIRG